MDFKQINKIQNLFQAQTNPKDRETSILEFQLRIFDLVSLDTTSFISKLEFIKIVSSNLEEFISIRLPDIKKEEVKQKIHMIESIYEIIGNSLRELTKDSEFKFDTLECEYRIISQKNFEYIYSGNEDHIILSELDDTLEIKEKTTSIYVIYAGEKPTFLSNDMTISEYIKVPIEVLMIKQLIQFYKKTDLNNFVAPITKKYQPIDFFTELQKKDELIRVPYESYENVLCFIDQMCTHPEITSVFITLYRTAEDSKIIQSLIKARDLGKSVFVYIEPTARGDEYNNIKNIQTLVRHGVIVSCSYFSYKVHSKIFCAVTKDLRKYTHIGTGNYNEKTAKMYTDIHLLTTNEDIGLNALGTLLSIFTRNTTISPISNALVHASPLTFRKTFNELIDTEIEKGCNGRIDIKCNNLCDCNIINKLYSAADKGVKIRIICRTGCAAIPRNNLIIRSKVGKYLEHDRLYIFGDRCFISSADLLLRNISKRVEILCEIQSDDGRDKLTSIFNDVWNSYAIHQMDVDGKWNLRV